MAPTATAQRSLIAQFVSVTGLTDRQASQFLKRTDWNASAAVNLYYAQNGPPISAAASEKVDSNLTKLFEKYRDSQDEKDTVGMEGIMQYCADLGVTPEDATCFVALEAVQVPALGEMTKDEFIKGWKQISDGTALDTITKQKSYIKTQISLLSKDISVFKRVYRHAFFINKERGQRALGLDSAIVAWETLFAPPGMVWTTPTTKWLDLWIQYLREKWTKSVNRDMWNQTFEFFHKSMADESMSFWSEDGAWPGVIDDFVAYVKEKRGVGVDNMETD